MSQFIVLIIAELLILFCWWLQKKMAGPKATRLRTYFDTWFSVIYVLVMIGLYLKQLYDPASIADLGIGVMMVLGMLPAAIYIVFLILLMIVHWIEFRFFKNPERQASFASFAWTEQKNADLSISWVIRRWISPFRKAAFLFSRLLLAVTMVMEGITLYSDPAWSSLWFAAPVCSLILIRTLSLYLDGPLADKKADVITTMPTEGKKLSNYAAAADHLADAFEKALLHEDQSSLDEQVISPERKIRELERSADLNDHILASYFRSEQMNPDVTIDPDYIQMAMDLSEKKNVLIRNPFHEDLGIYLYPALSDSLMEKRKVLILTHGNETIESVRGWISRLLDSRSVFQEQWRIRELEDLIPEADIGILPYARLYDPQIMLKNREFFAQTEYVILLRPSQVLSTMQIALNVLSDLVREGDVKPVFCIMDQNMDRLKDTLSHVLKAPIHSDVVITSNAPGQTLMIWDAEADYQAIERFEKLPHFLGGGIELMAEAAYADVDQGTWISENRIPVLDFQDRAAKSFRPITKVMHTEISQDALRNTIRTSSDPWTMKKKEQQFLIVEDEFSNPFSLANHYASRAKSEIFINVLSENYLLRDYFAANAEVFRKNPEAIPSLVPDFAKTRRNILLKLIMQMMIAPMSEDEVIRELDLVDVHTSHPLSTLIELAEAYTFARDDLFYVSEKKISSHVGRPQIIRYYGIHEDRFDEYFARSLKNTSYLLEDEISNQNVLDSKLFSLILQSTLPGQYVNYGGRSYKVKSISPINGVVLRRASDLIDSRKSYLQMRHYHLPDLQQEKKTSAVRINGFDFSRYEIDFSVDTAGYLEMKHRGSFADAKVVMTGDGQDENFIRRYHNKTVLEIGFGHVNQEALYQIALILQELMVTVLPTGYPYLSVIAAQPESYGNRYSAIVALADHLGEGRLLVIEDSDMDLGLLDEFENYFFRLLEIAQDYLRWNGARDLPEIPSEDEFENARLDPSAFAALHPADSKIVDEDEQARLLIRKIYDLITEIALKRMMESEQEKNHDGGQQEQEYGHEYE